MRSLFTLNLKENACFTWFDILLASLGQRKKLVITEPPPQARHNSSSDPENYNSEVLLASNDASGGAGPWHRWLPVRLWHTLSQMSPVTITQHPQVQLVELCALQHTIMTAISKVLEMQLYTYNIQQNKERILPAHQDKKKLKKKDSKVLPFCLFVVIIV